MSVMSAGAWLEAPAMENKHKHKHLLLFLLTLAFLFVVFFAICRFGFMFKPVSFYLGFFDFSIIYFLLFKLKHETHRKP